MYQDGSFRSKKNKTVPESSGKRGGIFLEHDCDNSYCEKEYQKINGKCAKLPAIREQKKQLYVCDKVIIQLRFHTILKLAMYNYIKSINNINIYIYINIYGICKVSIVIKEMIIIGMVVVLYMRMGISLKHRLQKGNPRACMYICTYVLLLGVRT